MKRILSILLTLSLISSSMNTILADKTENSIKEYVLKEESDIDTTSGSSVEIEQNEAKNEREVELLANYDVTYPAGGGVHLL